MAHRVELTGNDFKKLINNSTNSTWLGVSIATRFPITFFSVHFFCQVFFGGA